MEEQRARKKAKEEANFRAFEAMLAEAHEVRVSATPHKTPQFPVLTEVCSATSLPCTGSTS